MSKTLRGLVYFDTPKFIPIFVNAQKKSCKKPSQNFQSPTPPLKRLFGFAGMFFTVGVVYSGVNVSLGEPGYFWKESHQSKELTPNIDYEAL